MRPDPLENLQISYEESRHHRRVISESVEEMHERVVVSRAAIQHSRELMRFVDAMLRWSVLSAVRDLHSHTESDQLLEPGNQFPTA